jgi:hypothetical protein
MERRFSGQMVRWVAGKLVDADTGEELVEKDDAVQARCRSCGHQWVIDEEDAATLSDL